MLEAQSIFRPRVDVPVEVRAVAFEPNANDTLVSARYVIDQRFVFEVPNVTDNADLRHTVVFRDSGEHKLSLTVESSAQESATHHIVVYVLDRDELAPTLPPAGNTTVEPTPAPTPLTVEDVPLFTWPPPTPVPTTPNFADWVDNMTPSVLFERTVGARFLYQSQRGSFYVLRNGTEQSPLCVCCDSRVGVSRSRRSIQGLNRTFFA